MLCNAGGTLATTALPNLSVASFSSFRFSSTTGLTINNVSYLGFVWITFASVVFTAVLRLWVAPAMETASVVVRLAELDATLVAWLMSLRSVVDALRRGSTSVRPARPGWKALTVWFRATVEFWTWERAARMEAPSARTVVARKRKGKANENDLSCILRLLGFERRRSVGVEDYDPGLRDGRRDSLYLHGIIGH